MTHTRLLEMARESVRAAQCKELRSKLCQRCYLSWIVDNNRAGMCVGCRCALNEIEKIGYRPR